MSYRPTTWDRKRVLTALLVLYSTALLTSMAGMEIFGWTLVAASLLLMLPGMGDPLPTFKIGLEKPLLVLVVVVLVSEVVNGHDPKQILVALGSFRWIILLYASVWTLHRTRYLPEPPRALTWFTAIFVVIAAVAVQQAISSVDLWRPKIPLRPFGPLFRAEGFFNICITFANAIGIQAMFYLGKFPQAWKTDRARAYRYLTIFFCGSLGIALSFTRGSWIAWLAAVVLFLFMLRPNWKLLVAAASVALAGAVTVLMLHAEGTHKTAWLEASTSEQSFSERLMIWEANWEIFRTHPLLGVGWNQNTKFLPEAYAAIGHPEAQLMSHSHNNWLQILGGIGSLGFAAWIWVCGLMIFRSGRLALHGQGFVRGIGLGALVAQVYFQFCGMTDCNFIDSEVTHNLVWMWALTIAAEKNQRAEG